MWRDTVTSDPNFTSFEGSSLAFLQEQVNKLSKDTYYFCLSMYKLHNSNRQHPQRANPTHLFSKGKAENKYSCDNCQGAALWKGICPPDSPNSLLWIKNCLVLFLTKPKFPRAGTSTWLVIVTLPVSSNNNYRWPLSNSWCFRIYSECLPYID